MKLKTGVILTALVSLTTTSVSHALGMRMLDFMPAKYFTEKDWDMAKTSAGKALGQGKEDEVFAWHNEANRHRGAYRVLNTLEVDGRTCRDLYIQHSAGGYRGSGSYRFCRLQDGEWKTTGRAPSE
jgi:surface antigen